ncbi:hypothetical protein I3842_02G077100 [Carya illinoinensis]|uniref:Uncharacterized protein n=1 Tax=Carya illinoinensis TaxID=32201 RepID=A0A922K4C0_CARIL|nr:hypothetical protein I3842_02G077100 [Carya illinoinensis]
MCCQGEEMYWLVDGRVGGQSSQFLFLAIHHRGFGGEVLKRSFHSRPYISRKASNSSYSTSAGERDRPTYNLSTSASRV